MGRSPAHPAGALSSPAENATGKTVRCRDDELAHVVCLPESCSLPYSRIVAPAQARRRGAHHHGTRRCRLPEEYANRLGALASEGQEEL